MNEYGDKARTNVSFTLQYLDTVNYDTAYATVECSEKLPLFTISTIMIVINS